MNLPENVIQYGNTKKSSASKGPQAAFQREWQRVQNLQKQIEKIKQTIQDVFHQVKLSLSASESEKLQVEQALCEKLIGFVSKKSIPEYLREELISWVGALIEKIDANPFVNNKRTHMLSEMMGQQIHQLDLNEMEKYKNKLRKQGFSDEEIERVEQLSQQAEELRNAKLRGEQADIPPDIEDLYQEFFHGFDEHSDDDEDDDINAFEYQQRYREFIEHELEEEKQKDNELNKLLRATPISQLFRKISRAIHPDLESNESKKAEKHELMARLVQAREQKDIPTILNMYSEHVGELPEGLFQGNFDKLTKILKYQSEKLREEKNIILEENPVLHSVYQTFYDKNKKTMQRKINKRVTENKKEIRMLKGVMADITSIKTLRPYLEERYEYMLVDYDNTCPF